MTNHFRSLLLNLSDQGDSSEYITKGFAARQLTSELLAFYNLIFPTNVRSEKLRLAHGYLELIRGAGLDEAFSLIDTRITYDLDKDFDNFKNGSIGLSQLHERLIKNNHLIERMLNSQKYVKTEKYDNMWRLHPNLLYKIAALIVAYVIRLK